MSLLDTPLYKSHRQNRLDNRPINRLPSSHIAPHPGRFVSSVMNTDCAVILGRFKARIMRDPCNCSVWIQRINNLVEDNCRLFASIYNVIGEVPHRDVYRYLILIIKGNMIGEITKVLIIAPKIQKILMPFYALFGLVLALSFTGQV